jgi:5-methylcytosine-specific restriction endonuclease McrA
MPSRLKLPPAEYKKLTTQILQRDGFKCRNPKCKKRSGLHVHHLVFRSEGGDDASWNLIAICSDCHDGIHGTRPGFFIIVLPASGDPADPINADQGVKFLMYGRIRKRIKLKGKK